MKKTLSTIFVTILFLSSTGAHANSYPANVPLINHVTATSAQVDVGSSFTNEENARSYVEYSQPDQVCIMIYPTPENCKPKTIALGVLNTTLTNLTPNTKYSVVFKRDNTIACITTPCPRNGFESSPTEFATLSTSPTSSGTPVFWRNMMIGRTGSDVSALQIILHDKGYLSVQPTEYYGVLTRTAVRLYQKNEMHITSTGTVGPLTRAALTSTIPSAPSIEELFTGSITAVSTACFADGVCSVNVDGKKVVTTIGWSHETVGTIRGIVTDIGSLESHIGAPVKVYAKKTTDGYTLYGNANYYIEVL